MKYKKITRQRRKSSLLRHGFSSMRTRTDILIHRSANWLNIKFNTVQHQQKTGDNVQSFRTTLDVRRQFKTAELVRITIFANLNFKPQVNVRSADACVAAVGIRMWLSAWSPSISCSISNVSTLCEIVFLVPPCIVHLIVCTVVTT